MVGGEGLLFPVCLVWETYTTAWGEERGECLLIACLLHPNLHHQNLNCLKKRVVVVVVVEGREEKKRKETDD